MNPCVGELWDEQIGSSSYSCPRCRIELTKETCCYSVIERPNRSRSFRLTCQCGRRIDLSSREDQFIEASRRSLKDLPPQDHPELFVEPVQVDHIDYEPPASIGTFILTGLVLITLGYCIIRSRPL